MSPLDRVKTANQRIEIGKSCRKKISRTALADPGIKHRRFDPIQLLLSSVGECVPVLLKIKYERMSASAFAFFRGSVAIMAADLSHRPNSGIDVQLCGDAHVQNMGSFASPDGRLTFDINDFDETIRGPWEWDVKRMATSIVLAGRDAGQDSAGCRIAAESFVEAYCHWLGEFAHQPVLEVARHLIHRGGNSLPVHEALRQSQRNRPNDLLERYTIAARDGRRFVDKRPVLWRVKGAEAKQVLSSLKVYRECLSPERKRLFDQFHPLDVGFKVVGTGSVGLRDYVVLLQGNGPDDPLFLQIKQEVRSAYAPYIRAQLYSNQGQRVMEGQRAIQPASDPLLGWTAFGGHEYLVRQLNDHKGSINLETLKGDGLASLAAVAGELLARGHARSGDPWVVHGYCGNEARIAKSIGAFAVAYAEQTDVDYSRFLAAIKNKNIKSVSASRT